MPILSIPQKKLQITVTDHKNLMDALLEAQIPVASSCQGDGICSKCVVQLAPQGQPSPLEIATLQRNHLSESLRLSCQVIVTEDLVVTTTYW